MTQENSVLKNGARLIGETVITPGTSLLCDGQIKSGLLHVGAGLIARFTLGMPGLLLVAADSYSKTVTGKSLWQNWSGAGNKAADSSAEEAGGEVVVVEPVHEPAHEPVRQQATAEHDANEKNARPTKKEK